MKFPVVFASRGSKRRVTFSRDNVLVEVWCNTCKNYTCTGPYLRSKAQVRRLLRGVEGARVVEGCQTFRGRVVTFARRWAAVKKAR